jgi:GDP-L-fucose synthase
MNHDAKIYVAGDSGLVGSAIVRALKVAGFTNIITRSLGELDLTRQDATESFFTQEQPEYVFLAAAKVGGIYANNNFPADFININLAIQQNVINAAFRTHVKRLLFLGSSCIYPRNCPQPIKESYILSGPLEFTNRPYAIAKIAGIEQCFAYNRQYGTKYLAAMPTNLYGPGDNYNSNNSHVLPALLSKIHEAKIKNHTEVIVWGDGSPLREFLYVDDLADACLFLMQLPDDLFASLLNNASLPPIINIGYGEDITIKELVKLIQNIIGFDGNVRWDHTKPNGTLRKLLDSSKIRVLGWQPKTQLAKGISQTYLHFKINAAN